MLKHRPTRDVMLMKGSGTSASALVLSHFILGQENTAEMQKSFKRIYRGTAVLSLVPCWEFTANLDSMCDLNVVKCKNQSKFSHSTFLGKMIDL